MNNIELSIFYQFAFLDSLHECKDSNDSARRRYEIVSLGKFFWTSRLKLWRLSSKDFKSEKYISFTF